MKSILRKLKARTEDVLVNAAVQALDCVTPELIASWFKHCNHSLPIQLTKSWTAIHIKRNLYALSQKSYHEQKTTKSRNKRNNTNHTKCSHFF